MPDPKPQPALTPEEERDAERQTSVRAKVVHESIRQDGETELQRSATALAWSGLAAGLAMGFSLLAEGVFRRYLPPDALWQPLISKLGYSLGFVIVITGKQQLFTENTLTPIIPLFQQRDLATAGKLAKLWSVVLCANLVGAHLIAWFFSNTPVLTPELQAALLKTAQDATTVAPWPAFLRGIIAGWLIAMVVWLRAASESGGLTIIVILTYFVALGGFTHIVAGSVESAYRVMAGEANWWDLCRSYGLPVLAGNILGGVTIVAALNHAQVITEDDQP